MSVLVLRLSRYQRNSLISLVECDVMELLYDVHECSCIYMCSSANKTVGSSVLRVSTRLSRCPSASIPCQKSLLFLLCVSQMVSNVEGIAD